MAAADLKSIGKEFYDDFHKNYRTRKRSDLILNQAQLVVFNLIIRL